ncbi:MAG TPA: hypothetical protein VK874_00485, partial [Gaiellaceae bacterium]|nr:hypothetical protein [Gaiellaceae bacterium]
MSLLGPWLLVPAVLGLLCLGCGALVSRIGGSRPHAALLLPAGYAVVVVVASAAVWLPGAAPLAVPAVAGLAAAGLVGLVRRPRARPARATSWAAVAAVATLLAYGAPVLASGEATFAGYVSLDDSATWFALTDRALEHGRSTAGLAPSSYEATLDSNLGSGYPLGSLLPLGIAARLTGQDVAWAFQPYVAALGALLALSLFALARPLFARPSAAAAVAVVAAQPALLYAYAQWTGVKEVAAAALVAAACALAAHAAAGARGALPTAAAAAALACVLSPGGLVWLAGAAAVATVAVRGRNARGRAAWVAALTILLSLPAIATAATFVRLGGDVLTSGRELGNLASPLSVLQAAGIWPSPDFRVRPDAYGPTLVLVVLVAALAVAGVVAAIREAAWERLAYVGTSVAGAAAFVAVGSPWVDGKALATAAPAIVFAALCGCAWLLRAGRTGEAGLAAVAVAGGVLWSNAVTLRGVSLAPRDQLAELEAIGERYAGEGPALMTEYQPYGVRHFLRALAPEGVSELRRRPIPRRDGTLVAKGDTADLDELALDAVLVYPTLVLRRSPVASRPSSAYELRWAGRWYEVWQRGGSPAPAVRLPLGETGSPVSTPGCEAVERLATAAAGLVAAPRVLPVADTTGRATRTRFTVTADGRYSIWLAATSVERTTVLVDGRAVGSVPRRRDTPGQY